MNWNGHIFFLSLLTLVNTGNVIFQLIKGNIGVAIVSFVMAVATTIALVYVIKEVRS